MNLLVLGGSGFIGKHVVTGLSNDGHNIRVYDRNAHNYTDNNVETVSASFDDVMALSESLEGIDKVIHLISTSVPSTSNKDPISDVNGNLINTLKLLDLMKLHQIKDIVYFSSGGTVYGKPTQNPINEKHPTEPICSYGIVKLAIEKYLNMYAELYGLNAVILRPSNPYGPGQAHMGVQGFIGTCIMCALTGKPLTIWGNGEVRRDYVYVTDVADATRAAVHLDNSTLLNISSGTSYSLNEIIKLVELKTHEKINVIYESSRSFDVPEIMLDNSKAKAELNWYSNTNFETGIEKTIEVSHQSFIV